MEVEVDENVFKLDVDDGDYIIAYMPESSMVPAHIYGLQVGKMKDSLEDLFKEINVKILVLPHGTKIEYFKASLFKGE